MIYSRLKVRMQEMSAIGCILWVD